MHPDGGRGVSPHLPTGGMATRPHLGRQPGGVRRILRLSLCLVREWRVMGSRCLAPGANVGEQLRALCLSVEVEPQV